VGSRVSPAAPSPLDKGKGAASSSSALGGTGGTEDERRHRLRRADGSLVSDPLAGLRRSAPRSDRGLQVGPRRPAPRPRAHRGVPVLRHHHHRVRHHRNRHRHWARRHHLRGSSSSNSSGHPASRVAGRSRAPSKCSPILVSASVVIMPTGLNPSLFYRASSPSASKVMPAGGSIAQQQASPGSHAPARGSAAAEPPTASGSAAAEGVPTALSAATASTTMMSSGTPSVAGEEVPAAPAPTTGGDVGARLALSHRPLWRSRR
jgi:hypothetical protein